MICFIHFRTHPFISDGGLEYRGSVWVTDLSEGGGDLRHNGRVVYGRRYLEFLAVGNLLHGATQDLSRTSLRQALDHGRGLKGGDWSDPLAHHMHHFCDDFRVIAVYACAEHKEARRKLALELIGNPDDCTFGNVGVGGQNFFHSAGGKAVPGNVDDVVGARHYEYIIVLVDESGVGGFVITGKLGKLRLDEALVGIPQCSECSGRQRQLDDQCTNFAALDLLAGIVDDVHIHAGHSFCWRALFYRQLSDAEAVGADRPTGFGLPPVIDHGNTKVFYCPLEGVRIQPLAGQEQRLEPGKVVVLDQRTLRNPPS